MRTDTSHPAKERGGDTRAKEKELNEPYRDELSSDFVATWAILHFTAAKKQIEMQSRGEKKGIGEGRRGGGEEGQATIST